MRKSGKTPLLRARKLEKQLNVGEIYIKLEGANPSGHKHDRIAEVLIRDAMFQGRDKILVDGSEAYIRSVRYFAELEGLTIKVPLFKNEKWKTTRLDKHMLIDVRKEKFENPRIFLRELAEREKLYLIYEGDSNTIISRLALQEVAEECIGRLDYKISTIFTQMGYGYTLSSIYSELLRSWVDDDLKVLPQLFCGALSRGEVALEYYNRKMQINEARMKAFNDDSSTFQLTKHDSDLLEIALKAVMETSGELVAVEDSELKDAVTTLRKAENIKLSRREAYPMAAFLKKAADGDLTAGKHLIILNDGHSEVDVKEVASFHEHTKEQLIEFTRSWLAEYSDSMLETSDAVQSAMDDGFVLLASRDGQYQGICVIVNMGFEEFIPTYHLAYIGVKSGNKGRGVATELIQRAVGLTDGNISLHVDLDNKRAKKLYEKMGFKHKYNRMIFQNE